MKASGLFRFILICISASCIILPTHAAEVTAAPAVAQTILPPDPGHKMVRSEEFVKSLASGETRLKVMVLLAEPAETSAPDWNDRAALARVHSAVKQRQDRLLARLPASEHAIRHKFENFAGFSAEVSPGVLKKLLADPDVISVEPIGVTKPQLAQGIPLINGMIYRSVYDGSGVAVAVVDTGVDYTHPNLGGSGFPNSKVIGGTNIGDGILLPYPQSNSTYTNDHGTCCAGIVAGDLDNKGDYIGGVAPGAKLYAIKFTTGYSEGYTSDDKPIAAWDWCISHKNDKADFPILVINFSFGDGRYYSTNSCASARPIMQAAVNRVIAAGITFVAASGNNGYCDSIAAPACLSGVIAVGAVYDQSSIFVPSFPVDPTSCSENKYPTTSFSTGFAAFDNPISADMVPSYSNSSTNLALFAPANHCCTTTTAGLGDDSTGNYKTDFTGTSASAPYVAGAIASLQSAAKSILGRYLSPAEVRAKLIATGDPVTDFKAPTITKPRLNLGKAIASLISVPPVVDTRPASNVMRTGATLNADIDPIGGFAGAWFQWGTTVSYGFNTTTSAISGSIGLQPFSTFITNLNPGVTYHYRVVATNAAGTRYGFDRQFMPFDFQIADPLNISRKYHTATLLSNGKVLVTGGHNANNITLSGAEIFDPSTGNWSITGSMNTPREGHTATLLPNGKVLVAGGYRSSNGALAACEIYDPITGVWNATSGPLNYARYSHSSVMLTNGIVLVAGGYDGGNLTINRVELFDYTTGRWTVANGLGTARAGHTATLLTNGMVLVAAGYNSTANSQIASTERFNPATGLWSSSGSLGAARERHTATTLPNGKVLVAGGFNNSGGSIDGTEIYDPLAGVWSQVSGSMNDPRYTHSATLLPDGRVLLLGDLLSTCEIYDPATLTCVTTGTMNSLHAGGTAVLLADGRVLVAGGDGSYGLTEIFDSAVGGWASAQGMSTAREIHSAVLLPNGKVLIAGGYNNVTGNQLASASLYDPASDSWSGTGALNISREETSATLLPNGKVLVAGGYNNLGGWLSSAELYNTNSGLWTLTGSMSTARKYHTVTLLPNGRVLVAGGYNTTGGPLASAELYDPETGTWSQTSSMNSSRDAQSATLLPNGKVLVVGGYHNGGTSAELYDPSSGKWKITGSPNNPRANHAAVLLPNGKVLISGGITNYPFTNSLRSTEIYDPSTETWTIGADFVQTTGSHNAVLLPNGKVLMVGVNGFDSSSELYDPAQGTWMPTDPPSSFRWYFSTTLLLNGKVLVTGGMNWGGSTLASAELFDSGQRFSTAWQPRISTITSPLSPGKSLSISGLNFRGISSASGGNSCLDSSSDHPVVQLRSLANGQIAYVPLTNWSASSCVSTSVWNFVPGFALATVFVNGIPSQSSMILYSKSAATVTLGSLSQIYNGTARRATATTTPNGLSVSLTYNNSTNAPTNIGNYTVIGKIDDANYDGAATNNFNIYVGATVPFALTSPIKLADGSFRLSFTNTPGASFNVYGTSNLFLPFSNWIFLGGVTDFPPGQFLFTDSQAKTNQKRFYRIISQ